MLLDDNFTSESLDTILKVYGGRLTFCRETGLGTLGR